MLKKIAIIGPESSGKTFLAARLANHYKTFWVPEYAREYLEKLNHPYSKEDVENIARGQIEYEDVLASESKKMLFCDTNLLVIKVWLEFKYQSCPDWINDEILQRKYDLHLLTKPDIPYLEDPLRENPELGNYFFEIFEMLLKQYEFPYEIVSGDYLKRVSSSIAAVEHMIDNEKAIYTSA